MDAAFKKLYDADNLDEITDAFSKLKKVSGLDPIDTTQRAKLLDLISSGSHVAGPDLAHSIRTKLANCKSTLSKTAVVVVGAGPGGLRTAIEARVHGAPVNLIEKRNYISRNNILKLWPGTVDDAQSLGLRALYRKYGFRSPDKISIKRMQAAMVKVALLIGVQLHVGFSFRRIYPPARSGAPWTIGFHVKNAGNNKLKLDCDALVGSDGENSRVAYAANIMSNEVQFSRALGITFNLVHKGTAEEVRVLEFAKAGIMHREWFKEVEGLTKVNLENLIYFQEAKGTHYFVMAAKPESLVQAGVLRHSANDLPDNIPHLLDSANINQLQLQTFAKLLAKKVGLPNGLEFAKTHRDVVDASVFDFSKKRSCLASCKVLDSNNRRLLVSLVGDALVAPFWPLGTGANLAVLASFDACFAITKYAELISKGATDDQLSAMLTEQQNVFSNLKNCSPATLKTDMVNGSGTDRAYQWSIDPSTRYMHYRPAAGYSSGSSQVTKIEFDSSLKLLAGKHASASTSVVGLGAGGGTTEARKRMIRSSVGPARSHTPAITEQQQQQHRVTSVPSRVRSVPNPSNNNNNNNNNNNPSNNFRELVMLRPTTAGGGVDSNSKRRSMGRRTSTRGKPAMVKTLTSYFDFGMLVNNLKKSVGEEPVPLPPKTVTLPAKIKTKHVSESSGGSTSASSSEEEKSGEEKKTGKTSKRAGATKTTKTNNAKTTRSKSESNAAAKPTKSKGNKSKTSRSKSEDDAPDLVELMAQFGGGKVTTNRRSEQMAQGLASTMGMMGFEQSVPNKKSKVAKKKKTVSVEVTSEVAEFFRLNPKLKNAKDLIKALEVGK